MPRTSRLLFLDRAKELSHQNDRVVPILVVYACEDQRKSLAMLNSGQMLSSLAHSSLEVHCSYRLKFFVAKNHLRSSSLSNCSLLGSRFAQSCSTRPSQRSKYTGGVALRMRICIAVQRLSRKCVQKKRFLIYTSKLRILPFESGPLVSLLLKITAVQTSLVAATVPRVCEIVHGGPARNERVTCLPGRCDERTRVLTCVKFHALKSYPSSEVTPCTCCSANLNTFSRENSKSAGLVNAYGVAIATDKSVAIIATK